MGRSKRSVGRGRRQQTFEREDSGIGVHERRVGGDRAPERLHGHGHVDDDDAVLRGGLADADVLLRLHGDMGEGDELRGDAQAGELRGHCQWISEGDEAGRSAKEGGRGWAVLLP